MEKLSEDQVWKIIELYTSKYGFANHQLVSYNSFLSSGINRLITEIPPVVSSCKERDVHISFHNVYIPKPSQMEENRVIRNIHPMECRQRNLTYDSPIYVDIHMTVHPKNSQNSLTETYTQEYKRVCIGRIPIMLRSCGCYLYDMSLREKIAVGECEYDQGGYFIIKGIERAIVAQVRDAYNLVFVYHDVKKWCLSAETRSMSEETGHSVKIKALLGSDDRTLHFSLPYIKNTVPIGVVFKAMGVEESDIPKYIALDSRLAEKYIRLIVRDYYIANTREEALRYIGQYSIHVIKETERMTYADQVLESELFPHMGVSTTIKERLYMLGYMINRLLSTKIGIRKEDDRDNYMNKRVDSTGALCYELFRQLFKKYTDTIVASIQNKKQEPNILCVVSKCTIITKGFRYCFGTGNWGVPKSSYVKTGVSQILSRLSYGGTLSHLMRISLVIGKEVKNSKARQINPSSVMYICPCETPEGQPVGIVLNLTLLTGISEHTNTVIVRDEIESCKSIYLIHQYENETTNYVSKVFHNGSLIGFSSNPYGLISELEHKRHIEKVFNRDVSISYDDIDDEIHIHSDKGRLIRPVFTLDESGRFVSVVGKDTSLMTWDNLVDDDYIRYIDTSEANRSVIAFSQSELLSYANNYCEISPALILGTMASIIPFPEHSPSPRNCYISAMSKQAMSLFSQSHRLRTDTSVHVLQYPQKPLVSTRQARLMGFDDMPSGSNPVVAIMCQGGRNQEDSILIKKEAIDRGMFVADTYRTHTEEEKKDGNYLSMVITAPPPDKRRRDYNYSTLDENGIVRKRTEKGSDVYVEAGDVIIGKICIITDKNGKETITDCSYVVKKGEEGIVDRVLTTKLPSGYLLVKVVVRTLKIPEIGDKFVSKGAQKGTIGQIVNTENMPFTESGIVPDIYLNPHAIPSRMTIGQILETVSGKICAIEGEFGDATIFSEMEEGRNKAEVLSERLGRLGYSSSGKEIMYNGMTGEQMDVMIFIGPTYYQRLKHLVSEKIRSRARGPMNTMFRQPMLGRSKGGGLRFGEMEQQAMISHGCSKFLTERLRDCSDPFTIDICEECGSFATSVKHCKACGSDDISTIETSYASKLLLQELNAVGIKTSIFTE